MALTTVAIGPETQIIDLRTGKFTRQGFLIFQALVAVLGNSNTHESTLATTTTAAHVKKGAAVADAAASTIAISSADIGVAPGAYNSTWGGQVEALGNELKADITTLKTDVNNAITQLNALLSSLETAGSLST